jgi:hypothetical protein
MEPAHHLWQSSRVLPLNQQPIGQFARNASGNDAPAETVPFICDLYAKNRDLVATNRSSPCARSLKNPTKTQPFPHQKQGG